MDTKFSVTHKLNKADTPLEKVFEIQLEMMMLQEAARRTREIASLMLIDPAIAHYDWRGRLKMGLESKFSKWMKAARLWK